MTSNNLGELGDRLRQLARVPNLLIACDYDGTLAPLVDDPMDATPNRSAVAAMRAMAEQANTHVAVVSGRSLRDLALLSRFPEEIRLVGSHGSEFDLGFASKLTPRLATLRTELVAEVNELGARFGARIEEKPTGVTFHFRGIDDDIHQVARDEIVR
ncbi:MAG: trehalose-phosphatase, partial [Actinomycetia bacterium]|nr:trehalose-phosphatase [Actinomycetes bacterium]